MNNRQLLILQFIREYKKSHGFAPSVREITAGTHTSSTSVIAYHLGRLEEMGYIKHNKDTARTIQLLQE